MAEYVEREKVLQRMTTESLPRDAGHLYLAMRNMVKKASAADVVEVVHGEWREVDQTGRNPRHIQYTTKQCSVCGYWNGRRKTNYCPNCGADMRGERKCEDESDCT